MILHIEHSCESCKEPVQAGMVQAMPEKQVSDLDADDSKDRSEARKRRVPFLALRGEE